MVETRVAPRYRVKKPAQIEYGGDKITCTIRDISITGAALEVLDSAAIPEIFTLVFLEDGLKLPCRVVRRTDFRIGVAFDQVAHLAASSEIIGATRTATTR